ncbi:MAG: transposase [Candidatus Omnitrophica bacterium]|nr:transposase [Candidatus Omnitrophota bacterium]MCB9747734.1 transposase [Candidatus Omnitrophota bacterium]
MPRRARVVLPGYLYHVTQRGNNRQYIFQDDNDYILYLKRVEEYRKKYTIDIYAYCLMGNHVHFILKPYTQDAMAKMFRGVNMRYAQYYQKKLWEVDMYGKDDIFRVYYKGNI